MENTRDWLSRLLETIPVKGTLAVSELGEIPHHVILGGSAVLENPEGGPTRKLVTGDILLFPHGSAHAVHDESDAPPAPAGQRPTLNSFFIRMSEQEIASTGCAAASFFRPRMTD